MSDRIVLQVAYPYWTAYRANLELLLRSPARLLIASAFPLAGIFILFLWGPQRHTCHFADLLFLTGCFLFPPLIIAMSLFIVRRKNPLSEGPFTYTFDEQGVHACGEAFSLSIKWSAVRKVQESNSFMFFFISPRSAHCIPIAQVTLVGQLDALRALVRRMVRA